MGEAARHRVGNLEAARGGPRDPDHVPLSPASRAEAALTARGGARHVAVASPRVGELYSGVFQANRSGGGFVVPETPGLPDVFVAEEAAGGALHGDFVRVGILRLRPGRAPQGEIERILRHAHHQIVGQIHRSRRISIVRPKSPKITRLVEVHRQFPSEEVPDGAWVIVEITSWPRGPGEPLAGRLKEVLGVEGDRRLPILLLIREGGVRPEFPAEVEREAEAISRRRIGPRDLERRRDLRSGRVATIDPATAKDFDDAISLEPQSAPGWRVGVHIADVAHYVPPGSAIDKEAFDRATSIYPVDRVIPMLPEALSNDLCSLRPDEDRLTVSVFFTVSSAGEVDGVEIVESVIRSARRFNYQEIQGLFDETDGLPTSPHPRPSIPTGLKADVLELRQAARALLRARMARGALDLDLPEVEIDFDEEGLVAGVHRKDRLESHRLIEDLMIAANEAVARELTRRGLPLLYRVHEEPTPDRLTTLAPALARFGIALARRGTMSQRELQAAIAQAQRHPAREILQRWVLRSLARAHYQPANVGHFGLASDCYVHFTSPIRRYPDLLVHRAVKAALQGTTGRRSYESDVDGHLESWGRHVSSREERAQRMEWDAQKILTLEFMRRHLGDLFDGYISGVAAKGFFVELIDVPAEGFVPIRSLGDDFYDLDEGSLAWYGRSSGQSFAVGDRLRVQVERIDVLAGEMDLRVLRREARTARLPARRPRARSRAGVRGSRRR